MAQLMMQQFAALSKQYGKELKETLKKGKFSEDQRVWAYEELMAIFTTAVGSNGQFPDFGQIISMSGGPGPRRRVLLLTLYASVMMLQAQFEITRAGNLGEDSSSDDEALAKARSGKKPIVQKDKKVSQDQDIAAEEKEIEEIAMTFTNQR